MPRRRGRGEGSIYPYRNGFAAQISLGYDMETGKRLRRTIYGRTRQEVRDRLHALQEDRRQGLPVKTPEKVTVDQHFQAWLAAKKRTTRASTWESYSYLYRVHIKPALGRFYLHTLDRGMIDKFLADLMEKPIREQERKKTDAPDERPPRPLSRRTVQMVSYVLRAGLEDAAAASVIPRSPASHTARGSSKKGSSARGEARFLDEDELARFLAAARGARLENGFEFALTTGLRPGEWLGASWSAVDWQAKKFRVRQALHEDERGRPYIAQELKTSASRRTIALSQRALDALRRQKERQAEEKRAAGDAWDNKHNLIFTNRIGGPLQLSNVRRHDLAPVCRAAGLVDVGLHTLRHTHVALLIAAGADPKTIQARLGHADIRTTLQVYGHLFTGADERAAGLVDDYLAKLKPVSDMEK